MLQVSYLPSKVLAPVKQLPKLKISRLAILNYQERINTSIYSVVITVSNWHHIETEIRMTRDHQASAKLVRLYERYPWRLDNHLKHKDD